METKSTQSPVTLKVGVKFLGYISDNEILLAEGNYRKGDVLQGNRNKSQYIVESNPYLKGESFVYNIRSFTEDKLDADFVIKIAALRDSNSIILNKTEIELQKQLVNRLEKELEYEKKVLANNIHQFTIEIVQFVRIDAYSIEDAIDAVQEKLDNGLIVDSTRHARIPQNN